MLTVPAVRPLTMPDVAPTIAIVVALLLHEPPEVTSLKEVTDPVHTVNAPVMAAGSGFTVAMTVA
jgi:hypothetical protein